MNKHFEGTTINYIACLNVDYKSEREEAFQVLLFYTSSIQALFEGSHILYPCHCPTAACADVVGLFMPSFVSTGRQV